MMNKKKLEIYVHIPFCAKKCAYCDFLSFPGNMRMRREYTDKLLEEIRIQSSFVREYQIDTIFLGGGTPSILDAADITAIMGALKEHYDIAPDAEVTIEVNPGTVKMEGLAAYREAGINRVSMGLQSADDTELRYLGRIHTYDEFLKSFQRVRMAGFTNVNVDLISAIPGQTPESWRNTLKKTAMLKPEHISAYSLIIEEGTPFYERYRDARHEEELPDEETERQMYHYTREILGAYGYRRYEISNYAKEGFECRHNLGYWNRTEYLGIGTGAASLIGSRRWSEGEEPEELSRENQMEEYMFLGLRKMEGVTKSGFLKEFGCTMESKYSRVLKRMYAEGLMEEAGDYVRLTDQGIDISNYVMSEFLF